MDEFVNRPEASTKKIRTSDDFELCYLRHQYFRRVKYNPTESQMKPYMYIVENLTRNTYYRYSNLFRSVGMNPEDLVSIGQVQLVSFLGLYSLYKNKVKKQEYIEKFSKNEQKYPTEAEIFQKEKANFSMFFKQRMEDLVRVCNQKVRNIKAQPSEEYLIFYSENKPPKYLRNLLKNSESYGFKKLDFPTFRSIRKKAKVNCDATMFKYENKWYVALAMEQAPLTLEDFIGSSYDPFQNAHNMQPDEIYDDLEDIKIKNRQRKIFRNTSDDQKKKLLEDFIEKNKDKGYYKEEISTAKKLLATLGDSLEF